MADVKFTSGVGFNPLLPRSDGMRQTLIDYGMPPEAFTDDDNRIDMTVAEAAGWRIVDGWLCGPA